MHFLMQGISEFVVYLNSSSRDISSGRSLVHWHNLEYHWRTILHCCLVHCIIFREGLTFGNLGRGSDAFFLQQGDKQRTMENNVEHISDAGYQRGITSSTQLYSVFRAGCRQDKSE